MDKILPFLANHWMLVSAFVVLLIIIIISEMQRKIMGFKDLNPNETVRMINDVEPVLIDVREEGEFKSGHIVNSLNIPVGLLESRIAGLNIQSDKAVIVYCRSGQRSATAATTLQKLGFRNVFKLGGGIMAWQSANLPLAK